MQTPGAQEANAPFRASCLSSQPVIGARCGSEVLETRSGARCAFGNARHRLALFLNNSTGRLVSADEPAKSGDALIIFATGLGPVAPELISGAPAPLTFLTMGTFEVDAILIGGGQEVNVRAFFVGGAPGFIGVIQVNFIVSAEVPKGSATLRLQSAGFGTTQDVAIFVD